MVSDPILLVTRPKYGVFRHWGVRLPSGTIYEYVPGENLRSSNDREFAAGEDVTIVMEIPWHDAHLVHARLAKLERNPRQFDALGWNCETFARWIATGDARSDQVRNVLLAAGLVGALLVTK